MRNALSRRALLATPLLASTCAAAHASAPAPAKVTDELAWMIDTYAEIAAARKVVVDEIERIIAIPDQPFAAEVLLKEVMSHGEDYPADRRGKVFFREASIERFFANARHDLSWGVEKTPYCARVDADRDKALALFRARREERARFQAESGLDALDEQDAALFGKLGEIEKWLRAYACRSLADVVAIATFAEIWLADDGVDIEVRSDLLRAISAFAVATEER
ncbi:hypothetical protein GFB56_05460 [Ensifer sp. T173]|uniref:Tat pathway signal sequence domain protein n=1 Tax=Ensifer canadensis TaxID=555315 RepID=A0AAW4FKN5_9HYPH|nr:hypothetical protein [Ensifer canadensis]MBM3090260.1 hypothetical protein [Ensifer canadensis]UBI75794.1 hypothetical protein J3R84_01135 [Ensifer canadensis]